MKMLYGINNHTTPKISKGLIGYTMESRDYKNPQVVVYTVLENHPMDSRIKIKDDGIFQTMGVRGGQEYDPHTLLVMEEHMEEKDEQTAVCIGNGQPNQAQGEKVSFGLDRAAYNQGQNAQFNFAIDEEKIGAQTAKGPGADCAGSVGTVVRRLTPMECERLQGYPDGWTDIGDWIDSKGKKRKGDSDAPRYKALGNSIALPFWEWMAGRMVKELDTEAPTMASLFDGIGGFPLVFSRHGVAPVWASEIEEFPIAVTKRHFPEREETNTE